MPTIQKNQAVPRKNLISQAEKTRQRQLLYDTSLAEVERNAAPVDKPKEGSLDRAGVLARFKEQIKLKQSGEK